MNSYRFLVAELVPNNNIIRSNDEIIAIQYDIEFRRTFNVNCVDFIKTNEVIKGIEMDNVLGYEDMILNCKPRTLVVNSGDYFIGEGYKLILYKLRPEMLNVLAVAIDIETRDKLYLISNGKGNVANISERELIKLLERKKNVINTNVNITLKGTERIVAKAGMEFKRIVF